MPKVKVYSVKGAYLSDVKVEALRTARARGLSTADVHWAGYKQNALHHFLTVRSLISQEYLEPFKDGIARITPEGEAYLSELDRREQEN